ncbi:MAG: AsmA family protein [Alphaproteobacteria bacterium]|nr:AsmA family protein [Alphaproteobacteria bacterium]
MIGLVSHLVGLMKFALFVLVAAMVAIFIAMFNTDPGEYRLEIERNITAIVGREARISGSLRWKMSPFTPGIEISGLKIFDQNGRDKFITADDVAANLSIRDIVRGRLVIDSVDINAPMISLNISEGGKRNWDFTSLNGGRRGEDSDSLNININRINITDAKIVYRDMRDNTEVIARIQRATLSMASAMEINLNIAAMIEGHAVSGTFRTTRLAGEEFVSILGSINAFNGRARVMGKIRNVDGRQVAAANVRISLENLMNLPWVPNNPERFEAPIASEFDIIIDGRRIKLENLSANFKNLSIAGKADIDISGARPRIIAEIAAPMLDIPTIFYPAWEEAYRARVADPRKRRLSTGWAANAMAFAGTPLYPQLLDLADMELSIKITRLMAMPDKSVDNIELRALVAGGQAIIEPLRFEYKGGRTHGRAFAQNIDGELDALLLFHSNTNIGKIVDSTGYPGLVIGGDARVDAAAMARGPDLTTFVSSMNGVLRAHTTSKAKTVRIESIFAAQDIATSIARTFLPGGRRTSDISCLAINIPIRGGVAFSERGIAIETQAANIVIDGKVDLGRERIDASIITLDKGPNLSLSISDLVRIHGSIANPEIGISRSGLTATALDIGVATAVVGTIGILTGGIGLAAAGGLGVLGNAWLNALEADRTPCLTALGNTAVMLDAAGETVSVRGEVERLLNLREKEVRAAWKR